MIFKMETDDTFTVRYRKSSMNPQQELSRPLQLPLPVRNTGTDCYRGDALAVRNLQYSTGYPRLVMCVPYLKRLNILVEPKSISPRVCSTTSLLLLWQYIGCVCGLACTSPL